MKALARTGTAADAKAVLQLKSKTAAGLAIDLRSALIKKPVRADKKPDAAVPMEVDDSQESKLAAAPKLSIEELFTEPPDPRLVATNVSIFAQILCRDLGKSSLASIENFSYSKQLILSGKKVATPPNLKSNVKPVVAFNFLAPSPDDIVKRKQSRAFTRDGTGSKVHS